VFSASTPLPMYPPGTPVIRPVESASPRNATVCSPIVRVWVRMTNSAVV
jgi:hypothetical protein